MPTEKLITGCLYDDCNHIVINPSLQTGIACSVDCYDFPGTSLARFVSYYDHCIYRSGMLLLSSRIMFKQEGKFIRSTDPRIARWMMTGYSLLAVSLVTYETFNCMGI